MSKKFKRLLIIALYFFIVYALFGYCNISCIFLDFLGVPCPGCGMTHAFLSLVHLNITEAAKQNVVIFFMPYILAFIICDFKGTIHKILLGIIAVTAIVNWLIKIFLYFSF